MTKMYSNSVPRLFEMTLNYHQYIQTLDPYKCFIFTNALGFKRGTSNDTNDLICKSIAFQMALDAFQLCLQQGAVPGSDDYVRHRCVDHGCRKGQLGVEQ